MSEALHWLELVISSGLVVAVMKVLVMIGKLIQKQDDQAQVLDHHDERISRIEQTYFDGAHK